MKFIKIKVVISFIVLAASTFLASSSIAQTVTRLTFFAGDDITPAWDPRGVRIAYLRSKAPGQAVFDAYKVESSAQAGEQPYLTGINTPFGVATTTSWIGSTGLLAVEEAISGFELLGFNTTLAPFDRTVPNGADAANTLLLSINGGGGGSLSKISRDGKVALERFSSSGAAGNISIRTGLVSGMVGQATSTFGTALFSISSGRALFSNGGGLNTTGSTFVISQETSSGADLIIGSTTGAFANINLTNNAAAGFLNVFPDISPDGTKIVFARSAAGSSTLFDLFTINIDGTGLTQLTNTPNFSENRPSWSPDGGSVAFDGVHVQGHESEAPALAPGEAANYNIYVLTLPPANIVTPRTKLTDPPLVSISKRNVKFTLTPFAKAQLTAATKALELSVRKTTKAKVTFKYDLQITKSGKKRDNIRIITARNTATARNLSPGAYTARYRVQITSKTGSKPAVIKNTGFSPRASFSI